MVPGYAAPGRETVSVAEKRKPDAHDDGVVGGLAAPVRCEADPLVYGKDGTRKLERDNATTESPSSSDVEKPGLPSKASTLCEQVMNTSETSMSSLPDESRGSKPNCAPDAASLVPLVNVDQTWLSVTDRELLRRELELVDPNAKGDIDASVIEERVLLLSSELSRLEAIIRSRVIINREALIRASERAFRAEDACKDTFMYLAALRNATLPFKSVVPEAANAIAVKLLRRQNLEKRMGDLQALRAVLMQEKVITGLIAKRSFRKAVEMLRMIETAICGITNQGTSGQSPQVVPGPLGDTRKFWKQLQENIEVELERVCFSATGSAHHPTEAKDWIDEGLEECFFCLSRFPVNYQVSAWVILSRVLFRQCDKIAKGAMDNVADTLRSSAETRKPSKPFEILGRNLTVLEQVPQAILKVNLGVMEAIIAYIKTVKWLERKRVMVEKRHLSGREFGPLLPPLEQKAKTVKQQAIREYLDYLTIFGTEDTRENRRIFLADLDANILAPLCEAMSAALAQLPDVSRFSEVIGSIFRLILELHCFQICLEKKTSESSEVTSHIPLPWNVPTLPKSLKLLSQTVEQYIATSTLDALSDLRNIISEDDWQRLPVVSSEYFDLISNVPAPHQALLDFVLFTGPSKTPAAENNSFSAAVRTSINPFKQRHQIIKKGATSFPSEEAPFTEQRPVVTASSRFIVKHIEKLCSISSLFPFALTKCFFWLLILFDAYLYGVFAYFSTKEDTADLLADVAPPAGCYGGRRLEQKHASFLKQIGRRNLRLHLMNLRTFFTSSCAQTPVDTIEHPWLFVQSRQLRSRQYGKQDSQGESASTPSAGNPATRPTSTPDSTTDSCPEDPGSVPAEESSPWNWLYQVRKEVLSLDGARNELTMTQLPVALSPARILHSPATLYGLVERTIGVESVISLLKLLYLLFANDEEIGKPSPLRAVVRHVWKRPNQQIICKLFSCRTAVCEELREIVSASAAGLAFPLEPLIGTIAFIDWRTNTDPNIRPALGELRVALTDLSRRIHSLSRGSLPQSSLHRFWCSLASHAAKSCIEALARNTKPIYPASGPDPAQSRELPLSFASIGASLKQFLKDVAGHAEQARPKSESKRTCGPKENNEGVLEQFMLAHTEQGDSLVRWCQDNQTMLSVSQMISLLKKADPKNAHANCCRLEMFIAEFLRCVAQSEIQERTSNQETKSCSR